MSDECDRLSNVECVGWLSGKTKTIFVFSVKKKTKDEKSKIESFLENRKFKFGFYSYWYL